MRIVNEGKEVKWCKGMMMLSLAGEGRDKGMKESGCVGCKHHQISKS